MILWKWKLLPLFAVGLAIFCGYAAPGFAAPAGLGDVYRHAQDQTEQLGEKQADADQAKTTDKIADQSANDPFNDLLHNAEDPTSASAARARGIEKYDRGDFSGALVDLNYALTYSHADQELLHYRAAVLTKLERFAQAVLDLDRLIALDQTEDGFLSWRGALHEHLGNYASAVDDFSEAIRLSPSNASHYQRRAIANAQAGRYEAAMEDVKFLEHTQPDQPSSITILGRLHRKWGFHELALQDFARAVDLAPDDASGRYLYGETLLRQGRSVEAIAQLTKAIELAPDDEDNYYERSKAHSVLGNWDATIVDLSRCLELNPRSEWMLVQRAAAHALRGAQESAAADYAAAEKLLQGFHLSKWDPSLAVPAAQPPGELPDDEPRPENVLAEFTISRFSDGIIVPVRIGGHTLRFLVDTGCSCTLLDRSHGDLLGPEQKTVTGASASSAIRVKLYKPLRLLIGASLDVTTDSAVGCVDLSAMSLRDDVGRLDGMLGMDVLGQFVLRLDLAGHKLQFLRAAEASGAVAIPFEDKSGQKIEPGNPLSPWKTPEILLTLPDGKAVPVVVDTGMFSGTLAIGQAQYESFTKSGDILARRSNMTSTFSDVCISREGVLSSCRLGDFCHQHLPVEEWNDGNSLGLAYLARFVVTFDFPNHQLLLRPSPLFAASQLELLLRTGRNCLAGLRDYWPADVEQRLGDYIRDRPTSSLVYCSRGLYLAEQNKYQQALADFMTAVELEPANANLRFYRGGAYLQLDQFDLALADFSEAIRLDPTFADAFYRRGWIWWKKKQLAWAIRDVSYAVHLEPEFTSAKKALDQLLTKQRKTQAASNTCSRRRGPLARWRARRCARVRWCR